MNIIFLGTGKIEINGKDISYFETTQPRETVSLLRFHFCILRTEIFQKLHEYYTIQASELMTNRRKKIQIIYKRNNLLIFSSNPYTDQ